MAAKLSTKTTVLEEKKTIVSTEQRYEMHFISGNGYRASLVVLESGLLLSLLQLLQDGVSEVTVKRL